jgi:hypothetical protein
VQHIETWLEGLALPELITCWSLLKQESLGGNAKTVMIANVSPAMTNMAGTLRFAQRVKAIRNTVSRYGTLTVTRPQAASLRSGHC